MDWSIENDGGVLLQVTVSEELLAWLAARTRAPEMLIDPYRDARLDREVQLRWREEIDRIATEHRAAVGEQLASRTRLPAERAAREAVLGRLVDTELERTPEWRAMVEVGAILELALDSGCTIVARGD